MKEYLIKYALGGGFGGLEFAEEEIVFAVSEDDANSQARQLAVEVYESYEGCNGLEDENTLQEEYPDADNDTIHEIYVEEVESWIEYEVIGEVE